MPMNVLFNYLDMLIKVKKSVNYTYITYYIRLDNTTFMNEAIIIKFVLFKRVYFFSTYRKCDLHTLRNRNFRIRYGKHFYSTAVEICTRNHVLKVNYPFGDCRIRNGKQYNVRTEGSAVRLTGLVVCTHTTQHTANTRIHLPRRGTSSRGKHTPRCCLLCPAKWLHFYKSPHRVLIIPSKTFRLRATEQLFRRRRS